MNNTITLALEGAVPFDEFRQATVQLHDLIGALSSEISPDAKIRWYIDDLEIGSAVTIVRGESNAPDSVEPVTEAYMRVADALAGGKAIPFPARVQRPAKALLGVIGKNVTALRFETADRTTTVYENPQMSQRRQPIRAYGVIEGRVQTLTSRNALRFTLYDSVHDRAVNCYLSEGKQELMRGVWDRRAVVEGWISRDPESGLPLSVRGVETVTVLEELPRDSYRLARGVVVPMPGSPLPEETIRRIRDA